jgi:thymidylate synthase (FAD)
MTIIEPSVEILDYINGISILKKIEQVGRTCYKSEDKITDESCIPFVTGIIKRGHEAVIECTSISVRIICDRGVTHEIVRHRIASFAQESTRYVNYNKKGMQFIQPNFWVGDDYKCVIWENIMRTCEEAYNKLIESGAKPEEARSVLPNSLKTEIVVTANLREWRHILKLRTAKVAHPQARQVFNMILETFKKEIPVVFDDITGEQ